MPVSESVKPGGSTSEAEKHKHINREALDMASIITSRLTNIRRKVGAGGQGQDDFEDDDSDDNGVKIITLAGTNTGATFQGEPDDGKGKPVGPGETEALKTYVNSNYQAVNNSIMMGGSYSANDPGVHFEISDFADPDKGFETGQKVYWKKGNKKKKKKNEEVSQSDGSSSSTSGSESSN